MTWFLFGIIVGLVGGVFLGAFIAVNFDVINNHYIIEKLRAKKQAVINVAQNNEANKQPEKEKLVKRIFKFKRRK